MRIKKVIDSFFVLSKSERNGAIVLFAIVLFLVIFRFFLPDLTRNDKRFETDYDQRIDQLEKIKDSLHRKNFFPKIQASKITPKGEKKEKEIEDEDKLKDISTTKYRFDPNLVSFEELIRLGFSTRAARNLISYRGKGGIIREEEDLKRIYGIDSELYVNIQPYIIIHDEKANKKILIEINSADSAAFTSLKGIGPIYASRICKYRNYLRGFVSLEQLKEVYQLPEETYITIKEFLTVDENQVEKININFTDVKELNKHPYCSYEDARKIINYRSKKGYIQSVEQLLLDSIIEISVFNRFAPYLKVQ